MTTTRTLPRWLNPDFGPPEDLCERMRKAVIALAPIAAQMDEFQAEHEATINEYHDWEQANDSPDGVWQLINEATGYARCTARSSNWRT